MMLTMLKCKLHRATVTQCDLHYEGSIGIARDLIDAAGMLVNEQVDVLNINNGERFTTYVIEKPPGSGAITINGAAARKAQVGDQVIICAYAHFAADEAKQHVPNVVLVGPGNRVVKDT